MTSENSNQRNTSGSTPLTVCDLWWVKFVGLNFQLPCFHIGHGDCWASASNWKSSMYVPCKFGVVETTWNAMVVICYCASKKRKGRCVQQLNPSFFLPKLTLIVEWRSLVQKNKSMKLRYSGVFRSSVGDFSIRKQIRSRKKVVSVLQTKGNALILY